MFRKFLPSNPYAIYESLYYRGFLNVTDPKREWSKEVILDGLREYELHRPKEPWIFLEMIDHVKERKDIRDGLLHVVVNKNIPRFESDRKCAILVRSMITNDLKNKFVYFSLEDLLQKYPYWEEVDHQFFYPGWYNVIQVDNDTDFFAVCPRIHFSDRERSLKSQDYLLEWAIQCEKYELKINSVKLSKDKNFISVDVEHNSVDSFSVQSSTEKVAKISCNYRRGDKTMTASSSTLTFPSTVENIEFVEK